jgi:hypothetical protein
MLVTPKFSNANIYAPILGTFLAKKEGIFSNFEKKMFCSKSVTK